MSDKHDDIEARLEAARHKAAVGRQITEVKEHAAETVYERASAMARLGEVGRAIVLVEDLLGDFSRMTHNSFFAVGVDTTRMWAFRLAAWEMTAEHAMLLAMTVSGTDATMRDCIRDSVRDGLLPLCGDPYHARMAAAVVMDVLERNVGRELRASMGDIHARTVITMMLKDTTIPPAGKRPRVPDSSWHTLLERYVREIRSPTTSAALVRDVHEGRDMAVLLRRRVGQEDAAQLVMLNRSLTETPTH